MNKQLYFVEVGVLLKPEHHDFDYYNINGFMKGRFGFYDENKLTYFDYKSAKKYADYYIKEGVDRTYAIVYSFYCNITDEEEKEIKTSLYCDASLENPNEEDILYFAYKEKNKTLIEINLEG